MYTVLFTLASNSAYLFLFASSEGGACPSWFDVEAITTCMNKGYPLLVVGQAWYSCTSSIASFTTTFILPNCTRFQPNNLICLGLNLDVMESE